MPQETQNERARFACWYWLTWKKSMLWRSVTVSDCLIRVPAESCQWLPIYEYLLRAVLSEFVKHALFASLVDITCSCTMQFVGVRQQRWVGRCHDGPVSSQQTSDDAQRNTHTHLSHDQWPHANTKKLSFLLTSLDDEYDYFLVTQLLRLNQNCEIDWSFRDINKVVSTFETYTFERLGLLFHFATYS